MKNNSAQEILNKIKESKYVLINMDIRTDFDALCSSMVISHYLDSLNIKHKVIHANAIGKSYEGFFDFSKIEQETDIKNIDLSKFDLLILTDCSSENKISKEQDFKLPKDIETINIDHHPTNSHLGTYNYVFPYGAACTVIYQLFQEGNITLEKEDLRMLFLGICADTGFFRFSGACSKDFKYTAEIMEKGVNIHEILDKFKDKETLDEIKYKQILYKNLKINKDKKYAYSTITQKEILDQKIDMENIHIRHSDVIRHLENMDFSFAVAEEEDNKYAVSFRTEKSDFDVSKYAKALGGGGHKGAGGANITNAKTIQEAVNTVLQNIKV